MNGFKMGKIGFMTLILMASLCVQQSYGACFYTKTYASWYSVKSCKREGTWQKYQGKMANGKEFKDDLLTCASWDYPFGTILQITNTNTGKYTYAEVTDRGPAKRLYGLGRKIDLSKGAFREIANLTKGIVEVSIREIRND